MTRMKLILASFLMVTLLILSLLAWMWIQPGEEVVREETTSASSAYPGMSIRTWTETDDTYRTSIQVPVFQKETINERIRTYINEEQNTFHEKRNRQDPRFLLERPATFSVSFEVHSVAKNLHSIVLSVDSFTGTRDPVRKRSFMVDLETGESVRPAKFFKEDDWKRVKRMEAGKDVREEGFFNDVYLTNEEVVFLGDNGEESVSYHKVSDFMKDNWRSAVSVDKPEETGEDRKKNKEKNPVAKKNEKDANRVALTFDDGPHPKYTPEILDILNEYEQTATFFLLGSRVDFYPDVTYEIMDEGHEIGNHTWTHRDLTTLTETEIEDEISRTQGVIEEATGQAPHMYRPPYGAENQKVKQATGLPSILWTLDTEDWRTDEVGAIRKKVEENVKAGSVILLHDMQSVTPKALQEILEILKDKNLESVGISSMYTYPEDN